jgi:hypothetical protein
MQCPIDQQLQCRSCRYPTLRADPVLEPVRKPRTNERKTARNRGEIRERSFCAWIPRNMAARLASWRWLARSHGSPSFPSRLPHPSRARHRSEPRSHGRRVSAFRSRVRRRRMKRRKMCAVAACGVTGLTCTAEPIRWYDVRSVVRWRMIFSYDSLVGSSHSCGGNAGTISFGISPPNFPADSLITDLRLRSMRFAGRNLFVLCGVLASRLVLTSTS